MWEYKDEDVKSQNEGGGHWINKSGCYDLKIISAEIKKSNSSSSEGVNIFFEGSLGKASLTLWYKKKDGTPNDFNVKQLNRLMYLCKLKKNDVTTVEVDGKKFIKSFENKEIGAILHLELKSEKTETSLKDFYDIKTKKTSDEILNSKEAKNYYFWCEKFIDAPELKYKKKENIESKSETLNEDEFPF